MKIIKSQSNFNQNCRPLKEFLFILLWRSWLKSIRTISNKLIYIEKDQIYIKSEQKRSKKSKYNFDFGFWIRPKSTIELGRLRIRIVGNSIPNPYMPKLSFQTSALKINSFLQYFVFRHQTCQCVHHCPRSGEDWRSRLGSIFQFQDDSGSLSGWNSVLYVTRKNSRTWVQLQVGHLVIYLFDFVPLYGRSSQISFLCLKILWNKGSIL